MTCPFIHENYISEAFRRVIALPAGSRVATPEPQQLEGSLVP